MLPICVPLFFIEEKQKKNSAYFILIYLSIFPYLSLSLALSLSLSVSLSLSLSIYIYIYICLSLSLSLYIYIYIPRLCLYSVLMLSILIIFWVQIWANAGQYNYFYYISGTPSLTLESAFKSK